MGPEILAIVIISGILSLTSAGVSLGTLFHFKKKYSVDSKNKVGIDIDQSSIDEELGDLHRHVSHKKVHIDQADESSVKQTVDFLRTGLPNEVANKLASNAGVLSSALSSSLVGSCQVSESASAPKKLVVDKKEVAEVESSANLLGQITLLEDMDKSLAQDDSVDITGQDGQ